MLQIGVVAAFLVAAAIYAAPSVIAAVRGRRNWPFVVAINILLGWTVVGWLLAMAIAISFLPRRPAWMMRSKTRRTKADTWHPAAQPARREADDPPDLHEDVYAEWLDRGAGIEAGGQG